MVKPGIPEHKGSISSKGLNEKAKASEVQRFLS